MTTYVQNKKAHHNFTFLETIEAGAVLHGHEVKAIRTGKASLNGAYVIIRGGEAFLVGASISPYQPANTPDSYDTERARTLLLTQKQLLQLHRQSEQSGLTIVPIKWYNKNGKIKLEIAIARGKKKADKRETLKSRDAKREIDRTLKNQFWSEKYNNIVQVQKDVAMTTTASHTDQQSRGFVTRIENPLERFKKTVARTSIIDPERYVHLLSADEEARRILYKENGITLK